MTDDDQGCVERSLLGDHEAFEVLVRRYQRMIYSLAYRMTGSATDAEDAVQETFIRAHAQLTRFRREARFSSWLYRIGVNYCLNLRQSAQRRARLHEEWQALRQELPARDCALAQRVRDALMRLSPKQRAAVVLTTYDGLNHAEAGRALGCSETTVSWRLFVARAKLKRLLKDARTGTEAYE